MSDPVRGPWINGVYFYHMDSVLVNYVPNKRRKMKTKRSSTSDYVPIYVLGCSERARGKVAGPCKAPR